MSSPGDTSVDFRVVFETSPSAFVLLRADLTIEAVSEGYLRTTGKTRAALVGRSGASALGLGDDHVVDALAASFARVLDRRADDVVRLGPRAYAGGDRRFLRAMNVPILGVAGEVRWITHRLDDVTDMVALTEENRENAERQAELYARLVDQNRALLAAERLRSEFLASMSHELRTPLNAVIGFSELLADGAVGPLSDEQRDFVGHVVASGRSLLALVDDLVDLAAAESRPLELRPKEIAPGTVVQAVAELLRPSAATKRIALDAVIDDRVGIVSADETVFTKLVHKLATTALKLAAEGGRVDIAVLDEGAGEFRVEVRSSGRISSEAELEAMFRPFEHPAGDVHRAKPAAGLALALAKKMVEAHGGRVGVRATEDGGNALYAIFPRGDDGDDGGGEAGGAPPDQRSPIASRSDPPGEDGSSEVDGSTSGGAPVVLVVEGNPSDRSTTVQSLVDAGYAVEWAATGAEALARCRRRRFDAITLDLLLRDQSGLDVLHAIRRSRPNRHTPVIVVSSIAGKGLASGFPIQEVIQKPPRAAELVGSLERAGVAPEDRHLVIVVDDDRDARDAIRSLLDGIGYTPDGGADGIGALARLDPDAPLVLLDLVVPRFDGFELLRMLGESAVARHVPVLAWADEAVGPSEREKYLELARGILASDPPAA